MRQRQQQHHRPRPTTVSALLLLGASSLFTTPASAVPYPRDDLHAIGFGYLQPRQCNQYCGYQNQYCCSAGSTCMTQAGVALCAAGAAGGGNGGGWAFYTTTWTSTETFTSTISSAWVPATSAVGGAGVDCVPAPGSGQIACGTICCASDQYCAWKGQCYPNGVAGGGGGGGGGAPVTATITSGGQTITTQYIAPNRKTSDITITQTATSGTGVLASQTSTSTGNGTVSAGTASHLSPGAIAGIVIGVLAGVALLLLICACFLVRGLWHGLLALLGLGGGSKKRRHSETVIEEERYTRHGHSRPPSVYSRREAHGGWFGGGGRPSNVSSRKEKKKSSGVGWLGLGAAAGTLLLLLGLRKDRKKQTRPVKTRSDVSSSYFGSDSYTASSPSEF